MKSTFTPLPDQSYCPPQADCRSTPFRSGAAVLLLDSEKSIIHLFDNDRPPIFGVRKRGGVGLSHSRLRRGDELVLGPFNGKPACTRIAFGHGVCGTAAAERRTVVVPDVHAFPGHITCDPASRSEIVVPLLDGAEVIGVLDVDSPLVDRFGDAERALFERLARLLVAASDARKD